MDSQVNTTMGQTAENLAEMYSVTRKDADDFALLSQQRWKAGRTNIFVNWSYSSEYRGSFPCCSTQLTIVLSVSFSTITWKC